MGDMHAFPTVEQLQAATEDDLRANGFGYRAAYIAEAARQLHDKGCEGDGKGRPTKLMQAVGNVAMSSSATVKRCDREHNHHTIYMLCPVSMSVYTSCLALNIVRFC